jgi:hypothetical protein
MSVRKLLHEEALNNPAAGTPITSDMWQSEGLLEADFRSRLLLTSVMSAQLADVGQIRIEVPAKLIKNNETGYIDLIIGDALLHLKVAALDVRRSYDEAMIAKKLLGKLGGELCDLETLSDEQVVLANAHYKYKLDEATKDATEKYQEDPARPVTHKFAILQILPNRALIRKSEPKPKLKS